MFAVEYTTLYSKSPVEVILSVPCVQLSLTEIDFLSEIVSVPKFPGLGEIISGVGIETETGFDVEGGVEVGVVVVFPLPADGVELVVTTG